MLRLIIILMAAFAVISLTDDVLENVSYTPLDPYSRCIDSFEGTPAVKQCKHLKRS